MAFDGFFIRKLVGEIEENILGAHINKINNISTDEFILTIRKRKNFKLLLSASSSSSRFQLTKNTYENPNTPSNFCTVLRKYLIGGIIQNIEQINNDRIIMFKIKNFDELGYEKYYYLITELMGKHSNIILTDENKVIIESLKNSYSIDYKRSTIANMNYILPPTESKHNPFDFDSYKNLEFNYSDKRFLMKNFYGVSALLNNYFIARQTEFEEEFKSFCCNLVTYYSPILLEKNRKKDFYFFDVNNDETNIVFTSLCDLLDFYYLDIAKSNINKSTDKRLFDFIKTKLNRLSKKLEILNKELIEAEGKEDYKLKGQLLISNIYMFKNNVPEVATLQNFYSEELEDIEIELDPNLTIEKNSDRYFNLYKKNKKIVVFQGVEESPVSKQRLKGFHDSVQGTIPEEDITYYCGDWLRDRAELRMKDYLISHDSADIVFAFNDDMAYGAYQACQQYRIEGKVHLIGVDGFEGESAGLSLVDKGVLDATIQTPDFGGLSYEIARKLLEGNKVEKNIIIQPELSLQGGAERKE